MLSVKNLSFGYREKNILKNINFSLQKGEHLSIIGSSGCGKSTLLKLIYGLFDVTLGEITWNGKSVTGPAYNLVPGHAQMKYLSQDFGLMPYISVAENVGTFVSNLNLPQKQRRIQELLQMVHLQDFANEKPLHLSGGQQQRIALAMALAKEPEVLLLDEPFSQIDTFQKNTLRRNLFSYLKQKKITCIVATHDSSDALAFSDYIMVMQDGKNICLDTPQNVYYQLKNTYTSSLFNEISILNSSKIYYPWQIHIVEKSPHRAKVVASYFQGSHYLIECIFEHQTIWVNYSKDLEKGIFIFLNFT